MKKLIAVYIDYLPEATIINVAFETQPGHYQARFSSHRNDVNQTTINSVMDYGTIHQQDIAEAMFNCEGAYETQTVTLETKNEIVAADDLEEMAAGYIREMERSHNNSERINAEKLMLIIKQLADAARRGLSRPEPQESH